MVDPVPADPTVRPGLTAEDVALIKALGLIEASLAVLSDETFRRATRDVIASWLTDRANSLVEGDV